MRLELTRRGDYAVRAMLTLARPGAGQMTAAALAEATAIPSSYVPQVMGDLVRAGLVANRRGRTGGYALAAPPAEITLLAVVEAVEKQVPHGSTFMLLNEPIIALSEEIVRAVPCADSSRP